MRVLIVAATEAEIGDLMTEVRSRKSQVGGQESEVNNESLISDTSSDDDSPITNHQSPITNHQSLTSNQLIPNLSFLITGVGMVATAFALGKHLSTNQYDLVINLGIAGSFDRSIELGEVVEVIEDTFAELGAEDDEVFLPLNEMGFGEVTFIPSRHPFLNIRQVKGITVNKVHGNEASIQKMVNRLNPQLESMEGASVFYACKQFNLPCVQIRAVSNYVEKRNRKAWKIGLAVKNLNTFAVELVEKLS